MPWYVCQLTIKSNDGNITLLNNQDAGTGVEPSTLQVKETGCIWGAVDWEYSGNKTFLGFATTPNKSTPDYGIGTSVDLNNGNTLYIVEKEEAKGINITYNGTTTTLQEGQTATIKCGEKIMLSDLVIEYVGDVSLINFTIDGTEYQAEEGMTWEQWCNSNYNTYGYVIDYNGYIAAGVGHDYVAFSDSLVESDDVIINNRNYTHHDVGTGGSN